MPIAAEKAPIISKERCFDDSDQYSRFDGVASASDVLFTSLSSSTGL
jgi:hypothetical protein